MNSDDDVRQKTGSTHGMTEHESSEQSGESTDRDVGADVTQITTSEYNSLTINTNLASADLIASNRPELDFGVLVHQDGNDVALSAGTIDGWDFSEDGPHVHTYHSLTNEQARELAHALLDAADEAESDEEVEELRDKDSFLRRLMS